MNKKGFTLIEIIVCIALLGIIGTTSVVIIVNNNKKNDTNKINKLNKKLLEAASVFISSEKDDNGVVYSTAINNGAKGTKIPLKYLVDKGYISSEMQNEVIKYNNLDDSKNYYVMALNGGENDRQDYCEVGEIEFQTSWEYMKSNKPIYFCKEYNQSVQNNIRVDSNIDKYAVSETYKNSLTEDKKKFFVSNENGLFTLYDKNDQSVYNYYRGVVNNNFLKIGKDKDGKDLLWRVLWTNDKNRLKIVLNDEIPLIFKKKNGDFYNIQVGDTISKINKVDEYILNLSYNSNNQYETINGIYHVYKTLKYTSNDLLDISLTSPLTDETYNSGNFYFYFLNEWYSSTNLSDIDFLIKENNFCANKYETLGDYFDYNQFKNLIAFSCGSYEDYYEKLEDIIEPDEFVEYKNNYISTPIGFLTYNEVVNAGLTKNPYSGSSFSSPTNIVDSGNFLLNKSDNSYLIDNKFFVNNNGLIENKYYSYNTTNTERVSVRIYYSDTEYIEYSYFPNRVNYTKITFYANTIKPAIVLNIEGKKLSGNGTKENPFVIENN